VSVRACARDARRSAEGRSSVPEPGSPLPSGTPRRTIEPSEALATLVARYVPISRWLPSYNRDWLRADGIAGITSWGVMVPVALAYAGLAGVPPELGLVAAFAALAAYAVFGTSRHLKVTVSSTMAIMSASVVGDLAGGDATVYVALTAALALIVGGILVAAGLARLGFISDFLTKSVVTGFIVGLAITIINYYHLLPRKLAFEMSSHPPVNFLAYFAIAIVYSAGTETEIPLDIPTLIAGAFVLPHPRRRVPDPTRRFELPRG